jgi:FkbM family methyltransferase
MDSKRLEAKWASIEASIDAASPWEYDRKWGRCRQALYADFGFFKVPQHDLDRLASLQNKYAGERIFVMGNGPSLNRTPLHLLESEFTFGVNRIYLLYDRINWKPSFYTSLDWRVVPDNAREINGLTGSTFFFEERFRGLLREGPDVFYYAHEGSKKPAPGQPAFSYDVSSGGTRGAGSVVGTAIQLAFFMGFDPIYLIGCDLGYRIKETVQQEGEDRFGTGVRVNLTSTRDDDPNHFDPSYFGKGAEWHDPNVTRMIEGHEECRKGIAAQGRRIFNATVGGELDVYERVDFNTLFEDSRSHAGSPILDGASRNRRGSSAALTEVSRAPVVGPYDREHKGTVNESHVIADLFSKQSDGVLLDVGAHHGSSLAPFAAKGWTVIACEPSSTNRRVLTKRYGSHPQVTIDQRAVGAEAAAGVALFESSESSGITTLRPFRESHHNSENVDITTVSELVMRHDLEKIDVLKIDVEGYDFDVLKGVPWNRLEPEAIECEFEDAKTVPMGHTYKDMADFLVEKGYTVYLSEWYPILRYGVRHDWRQLVRYPEPLASADGWGNIVAFREDPGHEALREALIRLARFAPETAEAGKASPQAPALADKPSTSAPIPPVEPSASEPAEPLPAEKAVSERGTWRVRAYLWTRERSPAAFALGQALIWCARMVRRRWVPTASYAAVWGVVVTLALVDAGGGGAALWIAAGGLAVAAFLGLGLGSARFIVRQRLQVRVDAEDSAQPPSTARKHYVRTYRYLRARSPSLFAVGRFAAWLRRAIRSRPLWALLQLVVIGVAAAGAISVDEALLAVALWAVFISAVVALAITLAVGYAVAQLGAAEARIQERQASLERLVDQTSGELRKVHRSTAQQLAGDVADVRAQQAKYRNELVERANGLEAEQREQGQRWNADKSHLESGIANAREEIADVLARLRVEGAETERRLIDSLNQLRRVERENVERLTGSLGDVARQHEATRQSVAARSDETVRMVADLRAERERAGHELAGRLDALSRRHGSDLARLARELADLARAQDSVRATLIDSVGALRSERVAAESRLASQFEALSRAHESAESTVRESLDALQADLLAVRDQVSVEITDVRVGREDAEERLAKQLAALEGTNSERFERMTVDLGQLRTDRASLEASLSERLASLSAAQAARIDVVSTDLTAVRESHRAESDSFGGTLDALGKKYDRILQQLEERQQEVATELSAEMDAVRVQLADMSMRELALDTLSVLRHVRRLWDIHNDLGSVGDEAEAKEHGHALLMDVLVDEARAAPHILRGKTLVEVGSTRERVAHQGSTEKLAIFTSLVGMRFITVDMDPNNTDRVRKVISRVNENSLAVNDRGEHYLAKCDERIDYVYLDAFDFCHTGHSELRRQRYREDLDTDITDLESWEVHRNCAESVVKRMPMGGIVVFDDTWLTETGEYGGKGKLAVPYLLERGFDVIRQGNEGIALKRVEGS